MAGANWVHRSTSRFFASSVCRKRTSTDCDERRLPSGDLGNIGTLNAWALSLGLPGFFARSGIFSQYVIGSAELVASLLLLAGLLSGRVLVQGAGALLSLGVISGAIFFHLFTPLGVVVVNADGSRDGGELFILACGVWLAAALILILRRRALLMSLPGRRAAGKAMA